MTTASRGQEKLVYSVICTWCGDVIRHNHAKEARGMCLKCYARMLSEHTRSFQRAGERLKASER